MPPSNPNWKYGYVPSPGEWNNTFAGKVDYPAPLDQGGTGGQDAYSGFYNLQQREQIVTPSMAAKPLTFYAIRTDLTTCIVTLPQASACKPGDWIDIFDSGANAAINNITLIAGGTNAIVCNGSSSFTLSLINSGARCILVTDGINQWRTQVVSQSTGIGLAASGVRSISASVTADQSFVGSFCKVSGAGTIVTLPSTGFIAGNAIAFDNVDGTSAVGLSALSGDYPQTLLPGDSVILVADGAGGWWHASLSRAAGGSGSGTVIVSDEGTTLGTATTLNFTGTGVTASLSAGVASIAINPVTTPAVYQTPNSTGTSAGENAASQGVVFTTAQAITLTEVGNVITLVSGGVYNFYVAPFNTTSKQMTAAPTPLGSYTATSSVRTTVLIDIAPVTLPAGTYLIYTSYGNAASGATQLLGGFIINSIAGSRPVTPFVALSTATNTYYVAATAPTTASVWTQTATAGNWYTTFFSYTI